MKKKLYIFVCPQREFYDGNEKNLSTYVETEESNREDERMVWSKWI